MKSYHGVFFLNPVYGRNWISSCVLIVAQLPKISLLIQKLQSHKVRNIKYFFFIYKVTKLQIYKLTRLQNYQVIYLQSYQATMLQGYPVNKLPSCHITKLASYEAIKLQSVKC